MYVVQPCDLANMCVCVCVSVCVCMRMQARTHTCMLSCSQLSCTMDCSQPGSSAHGILQARILEWVATRSSKGSSRSRDGTHVFYLAGGFFTISTAWGFPCGSAGKESCLQYGRPGFDPWVGKIPWRRERLPTPVFWPGKFHGLYSP